MTKLTKHGGAEQQIIKEFVPHDPGHIRSAGRLIVRATNYGSHLDKFDGFFDTMAADALTFEPPIELDRGDVEIVQYGGERYKGTFGMEVSIPAGHVIPLEYTRQQAAEQTL